MTSFLRALAGLALILPAAAGAHPAEQAKTSAKHAKAVSKSVKARKAASTKAASNPAKADKVADKSATSAPAEDATKATIIPSEAAARVIDWVEASKDNHGLPWAVVDKPNAAMFLFDPKGKQLAGVPVLIGIAIGDDASPGVGSKKLAELGPAEKTTPAGRFLAKFGMPVHGQRVLWVDYADSVALHPIPSDAGPKEKRRERMLSLTSDDNRITFGCINVPKAFYNHLLRRLFGKKGGYVYVLPDTKPLEDVFPLLRVQAAMNGGAG